MWLGKVCGFERDLTAAKMRIWVRLTCWSSQRGVQKVVLGSFALVVEEGDMLVSVEKVKEPLQRVR